MSKLQTVDADTLLAELMETLCLSCSVREGNFVIFDLKIEAAEILSDQLHARLQRWKSVYRRQDYFHRIRLFQNGVITFLF